MNYSIPLVVIADDFGYCEDRDRGILEAFQVGAVGGTSLLVNGQSAFGAVEKAKMYGIPLGLHLNLTEGTPCAPVNLIPSLVDDEGQFLGKHGFHEARRHGQVDDEHVKTEVYAQIERFGQLVGVDGSCFKCRDEPTTPPLPHVDGHNHIHLAAGMPQVLAPLLANAGIQSVRVPFVEPRYRHQNNDNVGSTPSTPINEQSSFIQTFAGRIEDAAAQFEAAGLLFPSAFLGHKCMPEPGVAPDAHAALVVQQLVSLKAELETLTSAPTSPPPPLLVELMVHPGYAQSDGGGDEFSRSNARQVELQALKLLPKLVQANAPSFHFKLRCCAFKDAQMK